MDAGDSLGLRPSRNEPPYLIVVARDHPDLWECLLRHIVGDEGVQIVLDRRQRERRRRGRTWDPDRRQAERRESPRVEHDLRHRSFLIVRQSPRPFPAAAARSESTLSR